MNTSYLTTNSTVISCANAPNRDVSVWTAAILFIIYGTIILIAVLANLFVLYTVYQNRHRLVEHRPGVHCRDNQKIKISIYFVVNLALADICIAVFAVPFQIQSLLKPKWILPNVLCPFLFFVKDLTFTAVGWTLVIIALWRRPGVMDPTGLLANPQSRGRAIIAMCSVWLIAVVVAAPRLKTATLISDTNHTNAPYCGDGISGDAAVSYSFVLWLVQFYIPLCYITLLYVRMVKALRKIKPLGANHIGISECKRNIQKTCRNMVVVTLVFFICWTPLQSLQMIYSLTPDRTCRVVNIEWWLGFHFLVGSSGSMNAFFYAILSKDFEQDFQTVRKIIFCQLSTEVTPSTSGASTTRTEVSASLSLEPLSRRSTIQEDGSDEVSKILDDKDKTDQQNIEI